MEEKEYKNLAELESFYWWHQGKFRLIDQICKKYSKRKPHLKILEVGCGTGETLKVLSKYGDVTGMDVSEYALGYCRSQGFTKLICADISENVETNEKFDLIFALDVLEHIQDDVEAVRHIKDLLSEKGVFILTVPAYKFLWSQHDEALHHKRRYHLTEIKQKLLDSGFKRMRSSYFIMTLFPFIAFLRLINNLFGTITYPHTSYMILPAKINRILATVVTNEANFITYKSLPFGSTIFMEAKKY